MGGGGGGGRFPALSGPNLFVKQTRRFEHGEVLWSLYVCCLSRVCRSGAPVASTAADSVSHHTLRGFQGLHPGDAWLRGPPIVLAANLRPRPYLPRALEVCLFFLSKDNTPGASLATGAACCCTLAFELCSLVCAAGKDGNVDQHHGEPAELLPVSAVPFVDGADEPTRLCANAGASESARKV